MAEAQRRRRVVVSYLVERVVYLITRDCLARRVDCPVRERQLVHRQRIVFARAHRRFFNRIFRA